ncbi:MAG: S46 family peptidase [Chitinophagales bacterium]|nr:S46 family peptidase [Chitinophagaceae bacterium]MCB9064496.1 S46 family peptidase [Chitinophagales bacterium]
MKKNQVAVLYKTVIIILLVGFGFQAQARKGMWLPPQLNTQENTMRNMGLQIPVEQLYNEDGTGLNNAIVLFGRGCTGEVISSKGLVLTNHHCGYGTVQGLSSKEKDYFANGFWAMKHGEELPCPGLTVTFIRKMENVSDRILIGLDDTLQGIARDSIINIRIKNLEKGYKYATKLNAEIKPYYYGNQYWVILSETFKDIRLVGFPPNGIGTFGGDTDNWMWPRHTGDFSLFRIYAGADNKPADFNENNKPYTPDKFFTINANGYKEGDFTMVYGFPGYTQEYISSYQLNHIFEIIDPVRIECRTALLETWQKKMDESRDIFLKYTSKHKRVANGWKKWQGEVRGLRLNNVPSMKTGYEGIFQGWTTTDETMPFADNLLSRIGASSLAVGDQIKANYYIQEAVYGIEILRQGDDLDKMLSVFRSGASGTQLSDSLQKLAKRWAGFYKNYDVGTDKEVFKALMPLYFEKSANYVPKLFKDQYNRSGSYEKWMNYVFKSMATDKEKLEKFASTNNPADSTIIMSDPVWQLYHAMTEFTNAKIKPSLSAYYDKMEYLNRLYMKAQMKLDHSTEFFPDANLTLRLTYGNVQGIDPDGPAGYSYQTNLDEAVDKHNPDVEEFDMPEKLRELNKNKDYGRWGENGTVPACFIATNHTTGGNSGSPVLNAKGELIGTNFDRIWEGTMSDLYFDPNLCRNISVDIRYTMFIIEKFGGASWLLDEMKFASKK